VVAAHQVDEPGGGARRCVGNHGGYKHVEDTLAQASSHVHAPASQEQRVVTQLAQASDPGHRARHPSGAGPVHPGAAHWLAQQSNRSHPAAHRAPW